VCVCVFVCVCLHACAYKLCPKRYVQVSSYKIFIRDIILSSGMTDTLDKKTKQAYKYNKNPNSSRPDNILCGRKV
jgi:hypothetical protein